MGIILIRVFLGLVLLTNGWSNVREHSPSPRDLAKIVNEAAVEAPLLLGWLGEDLIAAQPAFFA